MLVDLSLKIEKRDDESSVMELLKTYVTFIAETAQTLMDGGNLKPA